MTDLLADADAPQPDEPGRESVPDIRETDDTLPLPWPLDREVWRPIDGWECYEVSCLGRVRSLLGQCGRLRSTYKVLKPVRADRRYAYGVVVLYSRDGTSKWTVRVHRLVAIAFHGAPVGHRSCVRHVDGDTTDDSINNLCWGTHSENLLDRARHGTSPRGEKNHFARVTREQVMEIVARLQLGHSCSLIAGDYGVSDGAIRKIAQGKSWGWLTGIARREASRVASV